MSLSDLLERLGRGIFEVPFQSIGEIEDAPEIAEIRLAIFDALKSRIQRAGGRQIFPYNLVRIIVLTVRGPEAIALESEFFRAYFGQEVRQHLMKMDCRFPPELRVEFRIQEAGEVGSRWLEVETLSEPLPPPAPPKARPSARLIVISGEPNRQELPLQKPRINIGRVIDVYKEEALTRRNDLAFPADNPINRTVSREHAHILYDKRTGEYRIFNDRWYERGAKTASQCGIWIVRDGMGQEVHRDARGAKLEDGDEIHFGKAVVEFRLE